MEIIYKTNNNYKDAQAFLFGLKGYSTLDNTVSLKEVNNYLPKKVFLAIDKNMFNSDLKDLEKILSEIDNYNVSGIMFYDLSVLSIAKRLNIKTPLIWNQNYLSTNYKTCNFYEKEGVKGAVIPPIITIPEILEICDNTNFDIYVPLFGYQMMAFSKRRLVSNYLEYVDEKDNNKNHLMIERDKKYPIIENDIGTKIYSNEVLNGIRYINFLKKKVKYIILDDSLIEPDIFNKVREYYERAVYNDFGDKELIDMENKINELIPCSTLFLDKKTVFKVKNK